MPLATNTSAEIAVPNPIIWRSWNAQTTGGGGTVLMSDTSTGTSGTASNQIIWNLWSSTYVPTGAVVVSNSTSVTGSNVVSDQVWTSWVGRVVQTEEQRAAERQRVAEYQQRQIAVEAEKAKARERAEILLRENLSPQQLEQLSSKNHFELDVLSQNGERRRYRIERKWSGSVHRVDPESGRIVKTLCIHPRVATPVEDSMLAQKLMLESGMEEDLLRIANHWN